ncbi:MAG: SCO family protein [Nitrosomonadales bacterium]|nr:SCO family protein [Nitrosomonadales bacterium]
MRFLLLLGLLLGFGQAIALEESGQATAPAKFDNESALQLSESVVGQQVDDYTLLDRNGRPFKISSYRGKPLLVSFIYTSCSEVCPATTQYLAKAVKYMQSALGADSFAVLTVGFNAPWDSPMTMRDFAKRQNIKLPNWEFASADTATMKSFTRNLGFSYEYSVAGFNHISLLTLIDQNGKVYRQVYGDSFELPSLGEPLKKLVGNVQTQYPGWEGLRNRIRLFCTVYDPKTKTYVTDYSFFVGLFISVIMIYFFAAWLIRAWRNAPKRPHDINQAPQ